MWLRQTWYSFLLYHDGWNDVIHAFIKILIHSDKPAGVVWRRRLDCLSLCINCHHHAYAARRGRWSFPRQGLSLYCTPPNMARKCSAHWVKDGRRFSILLHTFPTAPRNKAARSSDLRPAIFVPRPKTSFCSQLSFHLRSKPHKSRWYNKLRLLHGATSSRQVTHFHWQIRRTVFFEFIRQQDNLFELV